MRSVRFFMKPFVVGICGATCSGKSTIADLLQQTFKHSYKFNQDDFYRPESWDGHVLVPDLNHINWELETSVDNQKLASVITDKVTELEKSVLLEPIELEQVQSVIQNIQSSNSGEDLSGVVASCRASIETLSLPSVVIFEGITILNNKSLRKLPDLSAFISLSMYKISKNCDKNFVYFQRFDEFSPQFQHLP